MKQQNAAPYIKTEYNTQNASIAGKPIRAQGEQVKRVTAEEYLKDKMGGDADDKGNAKKISEQ